MIEPQETHAHVKLARKLAHAALSDGPTAQAHLALKHAVEAARRLADDFYPADAVCLAFLHPIVLHSKFDEEALISVFEEELGEPPTRRLLAALQAIDRRESESLETYHERLLGAPIAMVVKKYELNAILQSDANVAQTSENALASDDAQTLEWLEGDRHKQDRGRSPVRGRDVVGTVAEVLSRLLP